MPSRPQKSVSMYREEQVDTFRRACDRLEARGELDGEEPAGEQLAALSRAYIDATEQRPQPSRSGDTATPLRDIGSFVLGLLGLLLFLSVVVGGVGFLAYILLF